MAIKKKTIGRNADEIVIKFKKRTLLISGLILIIIAIVLLAAAILPQVILPQSKMVQIRVTDMEGRAIGGAVINWSNPVSGDVLTMETDETGSVSFNSLADSVPGEYEIKVTKAGFLETSAVYSVGPNDAVFVVVLAKVPGTVS